MTIQSQPIEAMPDVYRYGNRAVEYLEPLIYSFGLRTILLFPVITKTDQKKVSSQHALHVGEDDDEPADSNLSLRNSGTHIQRIFTQSFPTPLHRTL